MVSSLQNLSSQPNQPKFQESLQANKEKLYSILEESYLNDMAPISWKKSCELGLNKIIGLELKKEIIKVFDGNNLTLVTASQSMKNLQTEHNIKVKAINDMLIGMEALSLSDCSFLEDSLCELALLIPRKSVDEELHQFNNEMVKLDNVVKVFSEITTKSRPETKLSSISSSDWGIYIQVTIQTGLCLGAAIKGVLSIYNSYLDSLLKRDELKKNGITDKALKGVNEELDTMIENKIKEQVTEILKNNNLSRKDRGNELAIELERGLNWIAISFNKGVNFEILIDSKNNEEASDDNEENMQMSRIDESMKGLKFVYASESPDLKLPTPKGISTEED